MTTTKDTDLEIYRSGRSRILDELAREQAVIDFSNDVDLTEEDAANVNRGSFRDRGDRNFFKN